MSQRLLSLTLGTWLSSSLALSRHWLLLTWVRLSFCTEGDTEALWGKRVRLVTASCGFTRRKPAGHTNGVKISKHTDGFLLSFP
ncbi:hypothetical protein EYF80_014012 [Liparis tanakae]|uniref:Uncharacterized protein n=1 Tax=Liparis tanakae TaxID=230148 RepID=A0A4Z2IC78_9TELE|nr:hypothetical protein EYF80_014012 [Liparis tanakae]